MYCYGNATNYHQLSGFKEHKLIISRFWRLEVPNGSHWVRNKVSSPTTSKTPAEGQAPEHLDLEAHGASVHKTPKTMADEKPARPLALGLFRHLMLNKWFYSGRERQGVS